MQLIVVRHGQSANNAQFARVRSTGHPTDRTGIAAEVRDYPGRLPDPPLTELGHHQAEALGAALREGRAPFVPTHLYASPTTRAAQTARPLAEATGLPVTLHPEAYEVGGIHLSDSPTNSRQARPGPTLAHLQVHCPAAVAPPGLFDSPEQPWEGGLETLDEQALPRAQRLLAALRAAHGPRDVVTVVSHQFFSQFVLAASFGWGGPPWRRFRVDNTGHLSMHWDDGQPHVGWVNRVDHLSPDQITR